MSLRTQRTKSLPTRDTRAHSSGDWFGFFRFFAQPPGNQITHFPYSAQGSSGTATPVEQRALSQLSLTGREGIIDPFDSSLKEKLLQLANQPSVANQAQNRSAAPKMCSPGARVSTAFGTFVVHRTLGQGAFAMVYLVSQEEGAGSGLACDRFALKIQQVDLPFFRFSFFPFSQFFFFLLFIELG